MKKNITIIAVVGILLIFGFIIFNKNHNRNTIDEINISDWKIYENAEYGYQFKYPNNAEIKEKDKTTTIYLPEKYPELKDTLHYDEDKINISLTGQLNDFGKNLDEIKEHFSGKTNFIKQTSTNKGNTVLVYTLGQVYVICEDLIYSIHLIKQDPSIFTQDWLSEEQVKKLKDNYTHEIKILEKIYLSFEIIN